MAPLGARRTQATISGIHEEAPVDQEYAASFSAPQVFHRPAGDLINDETERGEAVVGETLLMLLNGHWEPIPFILPPTLYGHCWERLVDTGDTSPESRSYEEKSEYPLPERSL